MVQTLAALPEDERRTMIGTRLLTFAAQDESQRSRGMAGSRMMRMMVQIGMRL